MGGGGSGNCFVAYIACFLHRYLSGAAAAAGWGGRLWISPLSGGPFRIKRDKSLCRRLSRRGGTSARAENGRARTTRRGERSGRPLLLFNPSGKLNGVAGSMRSVPANGPRKLGFLFGIKQDKRF